MKWPLIRTSATPGHFAFDAGTMSWTSRDDFLGILTAVAHITTLTDTEIILDVVTNTILQSEGDTGAV